MHAVYTWTGVKVGDKRKNAYILIDADITGP
jgi:hypothetical protein